MTAGSNEAGEVLELEASALDALIAEGGPVLVDIWASWCGPCKSMFPAVETIARESAGQVAVAKLEIANDATPQNDEWTRQFGVRSVPTFILFKDGADIAGFAGTAQLDEMRQWLKTQLGSA